MLAPLTQQTRWRRGACWFQLTIMVFCSLCHTFFSYIEFFITEFQQYLFSYHLYSSLDSFSLNVYYLSVS